MHYVFELSVRECVRLGVSVIISTISYETTDGISPNWSIVAGTNKLRILDFEGRGVKVNVAIQGHIFQ